MKSEKNNYWKALSGFIVLLVISWSAVALMLGFGAWVGVILAQLPWWGHILMTLGGLLIVYPPLYNSCQEEAKQ